MKLALVLCMGLSLCALLASCQPRAELHIAFHPWVGYETLSLAEEFQWLPDNVVLHRFPSSQGSMEALLAGDVQAAALTLDEALRLRDKLPRLAIVLVMNESAGADVILGGEGVASVGDLKGARVAYQPDSVSEYLLRMALDTEGLSIDDVISVELPPGNQVQAFRRGDIDAVVTYPPMADDLIALGARGIFDSGETSNTIFDVLAVDRRGLVNRQEILSQVTAAHFEVLKYLDRSLEDTVYRFAEYQQTNAAAVRETLTKIRLPDLPAVRGLLAPGGAIARTSEALLKAGIVPVASEDLRDTIDGRYLPRGPR
ncbi:ABC transporter substrate-binding protein [Congregibacter litoralis]|uniref:ABC-type nitrate/sulfonate/bicarbonate transport system, periplasmic component n=1 Tax=Congregibacter litoralis KT71 TaxID=314285 RepID=A4AA92_9GAMM|nr:ABC transporter substrate-binding protein [Congregibacter litoralis]EAQ96969.1 ABC-type nitrate/sulfonate/bicarbonate transport system, periplasmic component [Congregibacter litoralis KT71]